MPRRSRRWVWGGRIVFGLIVAGLVVYLVSVGLNDADKVASSISAVLALTALGAPYLLPAPGGGGPMPEPDRAENTGKATATAGGEANTGVDAVGDGRPAHVTRSGNAQAHGSGSVANTGVQRQPRP